MIDEDGITKDLSDKHCAMLRKPPEKEKCDASRICLTPGIQRPKTLLIKILLTNTYTNIRRQSFCHWLAGSITQCTLKGTDLPYRGYIYVTACKCARFELKCYTARHIGFKENSVVSPILVQFQWLKRFS